MQLRFRITLFLLFVALFSHAIAAPQQGSLPTFYTYSTEALSELDSNALINEGALEKWEGCLDRYFKTHSLGYVPRLRLFTYLYMAQRDAAFLSYNTHDCFVGSLDPLIERIVLMFLPDFNEMPPIVTDPYSELLAESVFSRYATHFQAEETCLNAFPPECPSSVAEVARWLPWLEPLPPAHPPPSGNIQSEVKKLKKIQSNVTPKQVEIAKAWSGDQGLVHSWRRIGNRYMKEHNVPFPKILLVRAVLLEALYDGVIDVMRSKYTFCLPRPFYVSSKIKPLIEEPGSPSYPSGHAAGGAIFATVLSYFFPDGTAYWNKIGNEAANSRLYGGVHFPQDIEEGKRLGKAVANQTLDHYRDR